MKIKIKCPCCNEFFDLNMEDGGTEICTAIFDVRNKKINADMLSKYGYEFGTKEVSGGEDKNTLCK